MAYVRTRSGSSLRVLLVAIYLAVGIIVANSHHYFRGISDFKSFISAVLVLKIPATP